MVPVPSGRIRSAKAGLGSAALTTKDFDDMTKSELQ